MGQHFLGLRADEDQADSIGTAHSVAVKSNVLLKPPNGGISSALGLQASHWLPGSMSVARQHRLRRTICSWTSANAPGRLVVAQNKMLQGNMSAPGSKSAGPHPVMDVQGLPQ